MSFDGVLLSAIARLVLAALAVLLGLAVLLRGRSMPWLFSGAAAFLLGILLVRVLKLLLGNSTANAEGLSWEDLVPVGAAVFGVLAGLSGRTIAYALIGLCTGGALAIWVAQMVLPEGTGLDFWSTVAVVVVMLLGMLFVLQYRDVALILLSAGVGVSIIINGLALSPDSELVAAMALAGAIASLVIQYHDFLVELRLAHQEKTGVSELAGSGEEEVDSQGLVVSPVE